MRSFRYIFLHCEAFAVSFGRVLVLICLCEEFSLGMFELLRSLCVTSGVDGLRGEEGTAATLQSSLNLMVGHRRVDKDHYLLCHGRQIEAHVVVVYDVLKDRQSCSIFAFFLERIQGMVDHVQVYQFQQHAAVFGERQVHAVVLLLRCSWRP